MVIFRQGRLDVDLVQIRHEGGGEGDIVADLRLKGEADGAIPAGIVPIDLGGSCAAIQVCVGKSNAGEGREVEALA